MYSVSALWRKHVFFNVFDDKESFDSYREALNESIRRIDEVAIKSGQGEDCVANVISRELKRMHKRYQPNIRRGIKTVDRLDCLLGIVFTMWLEKHGKIPTDKYNGIRFSDRMGALE